MDPSRPIRASVASPGAVRTRTARRRHASERARGRPMGFELEKDGITAENARRLEWLEEDYDNLGSRLARRGVDIESLTARAVAFRVAVPSWGVGTGGTRFARFPNPGEPRNVFEKLEDCQVIHELVRTTPGISLHIP